MKPGLNHKNAFKAKTHTQHTLLSPLFSPLSATENEESEISDEDEDDDISEEEMPSVKPAKKKQI